MDQTEVNRATIARLMTILAGKTPIPAGQEFISQNVVAHMDGLTFHGINCWANWIAFIRTRRRVRDLDLQVSRIVANEDGTITVFGSWHAVHRGRAVVSNEGTATYRFENGMIAEIWTTRTNYLLIFGPQLSWRAYLLALLVYLYFWKRMPGRYDLSLPAAVAALA